MDTKKVIENAFLKPFSEQVKIRNGEKNNHITFPAGNAGCGGQEEGLDMQAKCLNRFFFYGCISASSFLFHSLILIVFALFSNKQNHVLHQSKRSHNQRRTGIARMEQILLSMVPITTQVQSS